MADLVGRQLEQWRLDRLVGRGGSAEVYLARNVETGSLHAVKVLLPQMAGDPKIVNQFREGGYLAASIRNSHIVHVARVGDEQGRPFIVTEYLSGGSLDARLQGRKWTIQDALPVLKQVAAALDHAHQRGIVHRDVKPSNILFSADGKRAVLTDFGISQSLLRPSRPARPDHSGTLAYMSPEQCQGQPAGREADIYSLAVMAYQMLTGRLPFFAEEPAALLYQHVYQPPPPPRTINPALSVAVEQTLLRGLAKNPAERFHTATAFVRALAGRRPAITPQPIRQVNRKEKAAPGAGAPPRRFPWPLAVMLGLGGIAVVWLTWQFLAGGGWPVNGTPAVVTRVVYVTRTPSVVPAEAARLPTSTRIPTSVSQTPAPEVAATADTSQNPLTPTPAALNLPVAQCERPDIAQITFPRMGETVTGPVMVKGTAAGPGFRRFEFYYQRTDEASWHQYGSKSWVTPVKGGDLAIWNPRDVKLAPGDYRLRLRVVDNTANYKDCVVSLVVR